MRKRSRTASSAGLGLNPWIIIVGLLIILAVAGAGVFLGRGATSGDSSNVLNSSSVPTVPNTSAPDEVITNVPRATVAQGAWYTVYFTKPDYPEKKENRVGGMDQAIVADIDRAQKTIDVALFDIDLPSIVNALLRAKQRGVQVRVVEDFDANTGAAEFDGALEELQDAKIPVTLDKRGAFMHNKVLIVDDDLVWTGSTNLTANDVYRHNNNMLRFRVPPLTANYKRRFEQLFAGKFGSQAQKDTPNPRVTLANGVTVENYFSPNGGASKAILDRLNSAEKSIRVLAFSYTADSQADVLIKKARNGVKVQGVFDARNIDGTGAEFPRLKRAKLDVLPDGNCYIQHNKVYIIDDKTVITGSYNFTSNAERDNDENLLIIDDPSLARAYTDEFNRIYKQAQDPTKCGSGS